MATTRTIVDILGGGPAGLAAAYYARQKDLPFRVFEGSDQVGGNCRTLRLGDFLFDTGAHRLHDRDPEITGEMKKLLGDDLVRVTAPSQIFRRGAFIDFPLYFGDIVSKLDMRTLVTISLENLGRWISGRKRAENFEQLAVNTYGPTLAEMFLLNYSRKLWGKPCNELSTQIAGNRLKGLDVKSFIRASLFGKDIDSTHIDGSFYYPKYGIGSIFERVAGAIGNEHIHYNSRITRIRHDDGRIRSFVVNGQQELETTEVVSTLPLTYMLKILDPAPPREILELAGELTYRDMVLAVFGIARDRVSDNASIYFPDGAEPYTRMYESKNRSPYMAPPGQTSIVLEIPCQRTDRYWSMDDTDLRALVLEHLRPAFGLEEQEIIAFKAYRIPFAYPVLEVGFEERARRLVEYSERFRNLHLAGRSAMFRYVHIHDLFRAGKEVVEGMVQAKAQRTQRV